MDPVFPAAANPDAHLEARPDAPGAPLQATDVPDVLIVGAGPSGIGSAATLRRRCKYKRYLIPAARAALGGTRSLFRYPGVRPVSGMYTLGYGSRPSTAQGATGAGAGIRDYIAATTHEHGIERHMATGTGSIRAAPCRTRV